MRRHVYLIVSGLLVLGSTNTPSVEQEESVSPICYYCIAHGFIAEAKNPYGFAAGTGFSQSNPWGQYTAYLMATNSKGQRTWRIEHYLPNPDGKTAQGSTMYLLEGSVRALLIDTANPAAVTEGRNDLKTLVHFLLQHESDGRIRHDPLDFVVANTHSHLDHIGENRRMSDRAVYYTDLDWPKTDAPLNYIPIRENGGPTVHGDGFARSFIELGRRTLHAVAIPPHTLGSTGYLDMENQMLFSGDALGSAWPFLQGGPLTEFEHSVRHLEELTRDLSHLAILPAHFYQIAAWDRGGPPFNGRPLDRQYILDQIVLVTGVLDGHIMGEPFSPAGRGAVWARYGTAQLVYSLPTLYKKGDNPPVAYHAIRIPGAFKRSWV